MSRIYVYPKLDTTKLISPNPYIDNLESALAQKHKIANKKANNKGVLDFYLHLFKADVFFINWIEYLPKQKFGKIQSLFFYLFLIISKLMNKKIIWVLHNKYSHTKLAHSDGVSFWKKFMFELMIKKSDFILTHSKSGIDFVKKKFPGHSHKVCYMIHPTDKMFSSGTTVDKEYDFLIWGTIHPYKGIIEFLEYISQLSESNDINIIIIGACPDERLKDKLRNLLSDNIKYVDKFASFDEITLYANKSRYILFTYNSESVLSSGSLMDSIQMGASIIGPNKGAFKDLSEYTFVQVFDKYNDIIEINRKRKEEPLKNNHSELNKFCTEHNWKNFYKNLDERIISTLDKA